MNSSTSTSDHSPSASSYVRHFFYGWITLLLLPALLVVIVDPYQIFHKQLLSHLHFYKNERFQNAGLLKTYITGSNDFDTVIIGTSQSSNFSIQQIREIAGWKAINLSMRGSTLFEKLYVLQRAVDTHKIRNVIFEISATDVLYLDNTPQFDLQRFPVYLYENRLGSWKYLFNQTTVLQSMGFLLEGSRIEKYYTAQTGKPFFEPSEWGDQLETAYTWAKEDSELVHAGDYVSADSLGILNSQLQQGKLHLAGYRWQRPYPALPAIENILLPLIRQHTDIHFYVWIAPNNLYWYNTQSPDYIDRQFSMHKELADGLAGTPNVQIFSFNDMPDINGNLNNYIDGFHFKPSIQRRLLSLMVTGQHHLTQTNLESITEQLIHNMENFNIENLRSIH